MADVLAVRDEYQAQTWAMLIQECNNSGLTKREFCRQRGISEKSFYYCVRRPGGAGIPQAMVHGGRGDSAQPPCRVILLNYEFSSAELREIVCYSVMAARLRIYKRYSIPFSLSNATILEISFS